MTEACKYEDIYLIDLNPIKGSEIAKARPCVIVSNNLINQHSPLCIIIPLTGNTEKMLPFHLIIEKSKKNGLKNKSKALTEQIKSLDKIRIIKKLGKLEPRYIDELENKIDFVLNKKNNRYKVIKL